MIRHAIEYVKPGSPEAFSDSPEYCYGSFAFGVPPFPQDGWPITDLETDDDHQE